MKKIVRFFMPLLLMVTLAMGLAVNVNAEEKTMKPNNNWVNGTISVADEKDYYTVTLSKPGFLTLTYQSKSLRYSSVELFDEDLVNIIWSGKTYGSSDQNPKTITVKLALEAGTYQIAVSGYWTAVYHDYTGDYRLKTSFTATNNQEKEPNNTFEKAGTLKANTWLTGFISKTDSCDYYKVTVPFKQKVTLNFISKIDRVYVELWTKDYKLLKSEMVSGGNEETPKTFEYQETLNKGTYYIKVYPDNRDYAGLYRVKFACKMTSTVKVSSIKITGNKKVAAGSSFTLKATVSPSNATNKAVKWTSSNTSIATVSSSGKVTTKLPGKTVITATAKDGSGAKKTCTVIVLPRKHGTLATAKIASKKAIVIWNKQKNVSGYQIQYCTNSSFNGAKTIKKGSGYDNVTLTNLKKAKYYVRIRSYKTIGSNTYYGAWSSSKTVNMK